MNKMKYLYYSTLHDLGIDEWAIPMFAIILVATLTIIYVAKKI